MMWSWLKSLFCSTKMEPQVTFRNDSGIVLPWEPEIDGDDIVIRGAIATWFGGSNDPEDDGTTASGNNTKGHPNLIAASLPMRVDSVRNLRGSPLPHMPFGMISGYRDNPNGAHVIVTNRETRTTIGGAEGIPVIDLGPALYSKHALDLTVAAFEALGVSRRVGVQIVDVRIPGGAKWV